MNCSRLQQIQLLILSGEAVTTGILDRHTSLLPNYQILPKLSK